MIETCITLRTLNYGNYGIFLMMGNAGFMSSTVFRGSKTRVFLNQIPTLEGLRLKVHRNAEILFLWTGAVRKQLSLWDSFRQGWASVVASRVAGVSFEPRLAWRVWVDN